MYIAESGGATLIKNGILTLLRLRFDLFEVGSL